MTAWAVADAKAKFSEVVEQAQSGGPQQITKNGKPVAVLVSIDDWTMEKKRRARKGTLSEFFQNSPLKGVKIERVPLKPRRVKF